MARATVNRIRALRVQELAHNERANVVRYINAWADLLEESSPIAADWSLAAE